MTKTYGTLLSSTVDGITRLVIVAGGVTLQTLTIAHEVTLSPDEVKAILTTMAMDSAMAHDHRLQGIVEAFDLPRAQATPGIVGLAGYLNAHGIVVEGHRCANWSTIQQRVVLEWAKAGCLAATMPDCLTEVLRRQYQDKAASRERQHIT